MRCQGQLLQDKHGKPLSVVGKLSDVHEMKAKEQELIESSSADALTGALNRRAAQERIEELLTHVRCGFLFMLDVDDSGQACGGYQKGIPAGRYYGAYRRR